MSVSALVAAAAEPNPHAVAIQALGRSPLTYARLQQQLQRVGASLASMGIGRGERVATLLQSGPDTAVVSLGVMASATLAPLNPGLGIAEVARYLAELHATALIVPGEPESPVVEVAKQLGLSLLRLRVDHSQAAGVFELEPSGAGPGRPNELAGDLLASRTLASEADVALVLHTSGTTSRPKIVPLSQRNLCVSATSIAESLQLAPSDTCLSVMPLFHVHGLIGALLSSIAAGASVACAPAFIATEFFDWLDEFSPTWYTAVPTMHQAILARAQRHSAVIARRPLRFIRSCSAALPTRVADELAATFGVPIIEAYGMTEAAHQVTTTPLPPGERRAGSVGKASGTQVAIADANDRQLAPGAIGEIVIRGPGVMAGYETDPSATASTGAHDWLRTGDQGFLDEDGYLFITGRLKELINRAGEKIAPREIDDALLQHPAVAQAIAFALPHPTLGEEVAAAIVLRAGSVVDPKDLRAFVAARLAAFKVPRVIAIVDEIPKGPTGKPQRTQMAQLLGLLGALPQDEPLRAANAPPATPTEISMAELWSSVLRVDRAEIGRTANFFHLGGDSVLAAQLVTRVAATLGVKIELLDVFEQPTLDELSELVAHGLSNTSAPRPAEIPRLSSDASPPLSFGEERMWWSDQLAPGSATNHRPLAWRIEGPLDVPALRTSLAEVVRRHAPLRTTFPVVGGEVVRSIDAAQALDLPVFDLRDRLADRRHGEAARMAAQLIGQPFDLARGPLLRASLLQLGDAEHVLLLVVHHIVFDAWSENVLGRELGAMYTQLVGGAPADLPRLRVEYADIAAWQRGRLAGEALERQFNYWRRQLAGAPAALELPADHPRPIMPSWDAAEIVFSLPPALIQALEASGRQANATLFMTVLAAFDVLLARHADQDDIVVGVPVSGRVAPETEPLIGFFINTLVVRTDLSGDPTFRELLDRVRQVCLDAYAAQEVPFERLVAELETERVAGRQPLVQVLCNLRNLPTGTPSLHGLQTTGWPVRTPASPFDLSLDMTPTDAGLVCVLTYRTELFDAASVQQLVARFRTLLEGIARDPLQHVSELPLLTQPERSQLLLASSAPRVDYPPEGVHELFQAQARANPQAIAIVAGDEQLTYAELDRRANQLAHSLVRLGAGPETRVGLCLDRSLELIVGLLGILKAGAAYVPLDPGSPAERLGFVLGDADVSLLVSRQLFTRHLPIGAVRTVYLDRDAHAIAQESPDAPDVRLWASALAYVLYTSGSTGTPNGVLVEHGSLSNLVHAVGDVYRLGPTDRVLQFASISFDASAEEIFSTLASGATLVLRPSALPESVARFLRACAEQGLSVLNLPTAYWHVMVEAMARETLQLPACVRLVIIGGEAARGDCLALWQQRVGRDVRLVNAYGPTEATVTSTMYDMPPDHLSTSTSSIPIGRPIANTSAYVLDRHLQPLPSGIPGELYLSGRGLARGYVKQPELTERKFVANPFSSHGSRLYRTGDRVRLLADGNLVFLGRTDDQLKLRGFRIELAEIEAALRLHPAVREAVVQLRDVEAAEGQLVAYLLVVANVDLPPARMLREFLQARLPEYMLPSAYVRLDALPLMPNGKVDRRRLPAAAWSRDTQDVVAPRTPLETIVADIWTALLRLERIGVHDNFFALGGHSLLAAQLTSHLAEALGLDLPVRAVFEAPTVASLTAAILAQAADDADLAAAVRT